MTCHCGHFVNSFNGTWKVPMPMVIGCDIDINYLNIYGCEDTSNVYAFSLTFNRINETLGS